MHKKNETRSRTRSRNRDEVAAEVLRLRTGSLLPERGEIVIKKIQNGAAVVLQSGHDFGGM